MSTTLDPEAAELNLPTHQNNYGPSDNSDSASDVIGTTAENSDSDAAGTGERASVENDAQSEIEHDIEPDRIITPAADGSDDAISNSDRTSVEDIVPDQTERDIESDSSNTPTTRADRG